MTTISALLMDYMGSDLSVVNAARVSFGKHKDAMDDSDASLIEYLAKHGHTSPFGHCFATFHCQAPIFVARQLVKHKFLRWNEISRRYVSTDPKFYYATLRASSVDKKQGSGDEVTKIMQNEATKRIDRNNQNAFYLYKEMLAGGICEEQARMVLPQSLMTEWYWSGSLDAFADMCKLRCKEDTQHETQIIAKSISRSMSSLYPTSWNGLCGLAD